METLANALKYARRHTHLHGAAWKVLVVSPDLPTQKKIAEEVARILDASSLKIEHVNRAEGVMYLTKGATIRFVFVERADDDFKVRGTEFCQIVCVDDINATVVDVLQRCLRSDTVPEEQLRFDEIEGII